MVMSLKVLENVDALKEKWRLERRYCRSEINNFISLCDRPCTRIQIIIHIYHDRQRERKKKIHLVLAITAMVAIALGVVGIRVGFSLLQKWAKES